MIQKSKKIRVFNNNREYKRDSLGLGTKPRRRSPSYESYYKNYMAYYGMQTVSAPPTVYTIGVMA